MRLSHGDLQKPLLIYVMNQVMKEGTEIHGKEPGVFGGPKLAFKIQKTNSSSRATCFSAWAQEFTQLTTSRQQQGWVRLY